MKKPQISHLSLILILGALTALSPFSIDMYLSAFPMMAKYFHTSVAEVSITLSAYFIGIASGQLFYGPLMDRFGRKKPLYVGLLIFFLASIGCAFSRTIEWLIIMRFIQAVGGCAASVGSFAMVRDLFEPRESAKVFSSLILILGISPLLAPTVGGYLSIYFGWSSVFFVLGVICLLILFVSVQYLPESRAADHSHVLRFMPITRNYLSILKEPQFYTYALSGAVGFSGLFVYLAASPTIFMEIFGISEQVYGWFFAFIAMGMIGASQLNVWLLKKYSNEQILLASLIALALVSAFFLVCSWNNLYNVYGLVLTMFVYLSCMGLSNPNSSALAMAPFAEKAGSAAALLGFLQMAMGASASICVGIFKAEALVPVGWIFIATSFLSLGILILGSRRIKARYEVSHGGDDLTIPH
jgi:MFS transporter, DHA1 family, multidrug resistance protein